MHNQANSCLGFRGLEHGKPEAAMLKILMHLDEGNQAERLSLL